MLRAVRRFAVFLLTAALTLPALYLAPLPAQAAASLYVTASSTIIMGKDLTVNVYVNTGGQSANAFQATISYPAALFDGVRGTFSGSICTLPVLQPNPSGGTASFSCGSPGGFNGTGLVASIVLEAKAAGSASLGLSGCSVLANDGHGTDISGGCSGASTTVTDAPTPTPTPAATPTPTPKPATPKPSAKPTSTPLATNNVQQAKNAESPAATPTPTPTPTPPPAVALPASTPTPSPGPESSPTVDSSGSQKRSIAQAFRDMFASVKSFRLSGKDYSGTAALLLTLLPFMALLFAIAFFAYRLYRLERRRRRTMDRLFEIELSELAALEGKMDLLAEKGSKGREEYREEFEKAKENILRQLRPDYGKPVEAPAQPEKQVPPQNPA